MRRSTALRADLVRLSIATLIALAVLTASAPARAQSVLVFDENSTHGRARAACTRLGITPTRAFAADFATLIGSGTWDLVIVDLPSTEPSGAWQSALSTYIAGGGRAIHTQWNSGSLAGLGASYQVTVGTSHDGIPFYRWSSSALFASPELVPAAFTDITDVWGTNGFYLQPIAPAYAAAGFTMAPAASQAAIVIGNSDRTIFNGFLFDDFTGDADTDTVPDIVELVMNEIVFLLGGSAPTAPCVGLMEGASCTVASGAAGTCRMGGCCTGCWDGVRCQLGSSAASCGAGGATCASCADALACTSDVCTAGACSHPPAPMGTACDDGLFCTLTDRCDASATCVGTGARCDDAESCTVDSCDETTDACANAPRPELTACTGASGASGVCRSARCCTGCWDGASCATGTGASTCGVGGAACASCVDTDSCTTDVCSAGACSNPRAAAGTSCDDGLFCTPTDRCDAAGACVGSGVRCNDMQICTTDSCDETADMCLFVAGMGCTIGGACVAEGAINPTYPCQVCDPSRDATDWSARPVGTECGTERCAAGRRHPAPTCDAAGACVPGASVRCPTGTCADATSCEPTCADTGCPAGEHCAASGECEPQLGLGETCVADGACASGECTDGVCCDVACDGACEACDVDGSGGTCAPIPAGEDPDAECELACDGAGACEEGDAGSPSSDGGTERDGGSPGIDGGGGGIDGGGTPPATRGGCTCGVGSRGAGSSGPLLALLAALALAIRRRRRVRY